MGRTKGKGGKGGKGLVFAYKIVICDAFVCLIRALPFIMRKVGLLLAQGQD
jgi:hypothetical protein